MRTGLLGLAIGLALADSSIVTLALPEILRDFDVGVTTVAWVLTSFNLVLALLAVPAAYVARRRARAAFVAGSVLFAAASLACGLAPTFDTLLGARCAQAVGAAVLVTAALPLLATRLRDEERAARTWVAAGVLGAALGPAAGGLLTEALGWESIFLAQVPLALVALAAIRGLAPAAASGRRSGLPRIGANASLLLLSGGLVAALFLLVLLLVEGWASSPATAGVIVTVIPVAALAAARLGTRVGSRTMRSASGVVLVGGGLAGLAVLPRAGWEWTVAPQILVGAGLGLGLAALTEHALEGREPVVNGGWTLAFRHAGVVLGLVLLAPLLTRALEESRDDAVKAATAVILDSEVSAVEKLRIAQDALVEVDDAEERGELPRVSAVFDDRDDDAETRELASALQDQLDRAVTSAFARPFLLAAALALAALVPATLAARRA